MGENHWNLYMTPPLVAEYSRSEVDSELIHSSKAYYVCHAVAKVFADCRRKPSGRIVNPETCQAHADSLMNCYNQVKMVPEVCRSSFEKTFHCLGNEGNCEKDMKEYIDCYHPASKVYETYP